jgi:tRNA-dihydrouridine synthase 4
MILAHEFVRSSIARDSDFTTCSLEWHDTPDGTKHALIAQFASSDPEEFARAADLIAPWVDGVDLNCGCPQSWAIKEGIGCSLQQSPELVGNMVKAAKARLGPSKSVSVKIRISKDLGETQRWIEIVENAGVDFITIHGRTRSQRSSTPPDYAAIRTLVETTKVPVLANGDAYHPEDLSKITSLTGAQGVMSARGILENPAVFAKGTTTSIENVRLFFRYAIRHPIPFPLVLHHISEMTGRMSDMDKRERRRLMECHDLLDLVDFVDGKWGRSEDDKLDP